MSSVKPPVEGTVIETPVVGQSVEQPLEAEKKKYTVDFNDVSSKYLIKEKGKSYLHVQVWDSKGERKSLKLSDKEVLEETDPETEKMLDDYTLPNCCVRVPNGKKFKFYLNQYETKPTVKPIKPEKGIVNG